MELILDMKQEHLTTNLLKSIVNCYGRLRGSEVLCHLKWKLSPLLEMSLLSELGYKVTVKFTLFADLKVPIRFQGHTLAGYETVLDRNMDQNTLILLDGERQILKVVHIPLMEVV